MFCEAGYQLASMLFIAPVGNADRFGETVLSLRGGMPKEEDV
jgi:hypothetical protein